LCVVYNRSRNFHENSFFAKLLSTFENDGDSPIGQFCNLYGEIYQHGQNHVGRFVFTHFFYFTKNFMDANIFLYIGAMLLFERVREKISRE
jgi:hypothetical protein